MPEETKEQNQIEKDYHDMNDKEYWEARQNLHGLFSVLIEVDKRINPHLYKNKEIKKLKEND